MIPVRPSSALAPLVALGVAALVVTGCGRTLQPRTSSKLDRAGWKSGAIVDASDAYPIAFWADPCQPPQEHDVAGDTLVTQQWLCHFARALNETLAQRGLYDGRFASAGRQVLGGKLEAGLHRYPCEPDAVDQLQKEAVRLAKIQFVSAERVRDVADNATVVRIEVVVGTIKLQYAARSLISGWDVEIFSRLGAMILSDVRFWAAVKGPL